MNPDRPPTAPLAEAAHRSSGSFELVLGPVLMALLGLLIDSKAGTRPLFTVLLALWGAAGAFVLLYYRYRHQMAELPGRRPVGGGAATETALVAADEGTER